MSLIDTAKVVYDLAKKGATIELQEQLMKMREEALSLQEQNVELRQRVAELEAERRVEESVVYDGALYWKDDDEGVRQGPYCQKCYDADRKLIRLQNSSYKDVKARPITAWSCGEQVECLSPRSRRHYQFARYNS
jgi:hypothetical protein